MEKFNFNQFRYSFFLKMILALFLSLGGPLSAAPNLWVVNLGNSSVSIIDTETNMLVDTITQSMGQFEGPVYLNFTRDGYYCYVNNFIDSSFSVIRVYDRTLVAKITSIQGNLYENYLSAITPDGNFLYATNYANAVPDESSVSVISIPSNTLYATISATGGQLNGPYPIAISPDGSTAYVGNYDTTTISVIDTSSNTLKNLITDASFINLTWIAFTPDGKYVYTANIDDGSSGSVSVIDTSTLAVTNISSVAVDIANPIHIEFSRDGTRAYITNIGNSSVSVIDTRSLTQIANITDKTFSGSVATVLTKDGALLYVLNEGTNSLAIVRTSDNTIVGHISAVGLAGSQAMQFAPRIVIQPPKKFRGTVIQPHLNKNRYVLKTKWNASSSPDVVSYKIYNGDKLVANIPATSPLKFTTCIHCREEAENFKIAAYNSLGLSSKRVKININD